MGTIFSIIIGLYCIVVLFIVLEKRLDKKPSSTSDAEGHINSEWLQANEEGHKWLNFASGLSDTPSSELSCRPLKK